MVGILLGASVLGIGCTLLIAGNFPGVLFQVTLAWILGVDFSACLEVGLRACMIGGPSMMRGIVMMGVLSINLCTSSLALFSLCFTLCCTRGVAVETGGVRMHLICVCSFLMSSLTLEVASPGGNVGQFLSECS